MDKYIIDGEILSDIAAEIRAKKGTTELIKLENFASEIKEIPQINNAALSRTIDKTITELIVPDDVTVIGKYVFFQSKLQKVTFHENLTTIENYALGNCQLSGTLTLPDSLTTIGENAFRYNQQPLKVVFGINIQSIGSAAFDNCIKCMEYDFSRAEVVPTLGTNVFRAIPTGSKIIVPSRLYFSWREATNWVALKNYIVFPEGEIPFTIFGIANAYGAREGMTWREWVNSEYNTDGYTLTDDSDTANVVIPDLIDTYGYYVTDMENDYTWVEANQVIESKHYTGT